MPDLTPMLDTECFFIAPIGKEGSPERNRSDGILDFIVTPAAQELGLTAVRGDKIGEPGQITLQILDHILGARAAVADLTGMNPNVFYELAVRHTGKLPVALIAEKGCQLPFDIAQMRTIFFDHTDLRSAASCKESIVTHLREAIEKGAVDSPIATSVEVRALQGGSAVERNIAELVTTVEEVSKFQRLTMSRLDMLATDLEDVDRVSPAALFAAVEKMAALEALIVARKDDELSSALRALEEPIQYLTHRKRIPSQMLRARRQANDSMRRRAANREALTSLNSDAVKDASESGDAN